MNEVFKPRYIRCFDLNVAFYVTNMESAVGWINQCVIRGGKIFAFEDAE